jgi:hypothetical protein
VKKILLIGGGPVGLTFANITSKHFAVQVITPNQPLKFKNTKGSTLELNSNSNSGTIFGNSFFWASQHDTINEHYQTKPMFSNLPGFPFEIAILKNYQYQLAKQGWPATQKFKTSAKGNLPGMKVAKIWKGKSFKPLPNFLDASIDFISTNFDTCEFKVNSISYLDSILVDQIEYKADIFVFAVGGLSNVAMLHDLSKKVSSLKISDFYMLGKGYTNHPKAKFLRVRFSKPRFFKRYSSADKFTEISNFDLVDSVEEPRALRISARLWPQYDNSNLRRKLTSRLLGIFGYYTEAQIVLYFELPQILQNSVSFLGKKGDTLEFEFKHSFPEEIKDYFASRIDKIFESISQDKNFTILGREKILFDEIFAQDANHHFGGTRMGKNTSDGVVDSFGKCFNVPNLFILGTSVLPVSSSLHPTFLSAALALRTADEIIRNG